MPESSRTSPWWAPLLAAIVGSLIGASVSIYTMREQHALLLEREAQTTRLERRRETYLYALDKLSRMLRSSDPSDSESFEQINTSTEIYWKLLAYSSPELTKLISDGWQETLEPISPASFHDIKLGDRVKKRGEVIGQIVAELRFMNNDSPLELEAFRSALLPK